ncbi:hypothetical protein [Sabulicella glaciei]|uniref:Lipoprotein n=1 Tax=Sabulicella glaciei TaxID=2984948 RepID=A0ABT3NWE3_9PROT|nr:hypothetical protein [Roseococcus sp. MDT2-1-1]MCW8086482.1 hypothetical protein [Roseococcus sp. MDT2-1-1]
MVRKIFLMPLAALALSGCVVNEGVGYVSPGYSPGYYAAPAPSYYAPPAAYYAPPTAYYAPGPRYYAPPPRYYAAPSPRYYGGGPRYSEGPRRWDRGGQPPVVTVPRGPGRDYSGGPGPGFGNRGYSQLERGAVNLLPR